MHSLNTDVRKKKMAVGFPGHPPPAGPVGISRAELAAWRTAIDF